MEGDMFDLNDKPVGLTTDQFVDVLKDLIQWIETGDSMEGRLTYEWGVEQDYKVVGALRFGNSSMGQGSIRMIQEQ